MRVLCIIDSLGAGGAETSLVHIAPSLTAAGIDLHVAYLKNRSDLRGALRSGGADVHPVGFDAGRLSQVRALARVIREVEPDLVHTTLWEADVLGRSAALLTRTPVVTTFASAGYSTAHYANPNVKRTRLRAAQVIDAGTARAACRFHAVAQHVADDMAKRLWIRRTCIDVIPRARDRSRLGEPTPQRRALVRDRLGLDDRPTVLAVARHEHEKALDVLVAATSLVRASVPDVKVLIAGPAGRSTGTINAAIVESGAGDALELLGYRTDVADLMVASDVVVVPSRVEGFPGVVLEAMALERPVVATDLPSVREAMAGHAYALVPVDDRQTLATQVIACLYDPQARRVGAMSRRHFDRSYTPPVVATRMQEFYAAAIASRPRAG